MLSNVHITVDFGDKPLEQNQILYHCYTSASHWRDDFMAWCPNNVLAIWSLWSPSKLKLQQPVLLRTTIYILREIFLPSIFVDESNYNDNNVMSLDINNIFV